MKCYYLIRCDLSTALQNNTIRVAVSNSFRKIKLTKLDTRNAASTLMVLWRNIMPAYGSGSFPFTTAPWPLLVFISCVSFAC